MTEGLQLRTSLFRFLPDPLALPFFFVRAGCSSMRLDISESDRASWIGQEQERAIRSSSIALRRCETRLDSPPRGFL